MGPVVQLWRRAPGRGRQQVRGNLQAHRFRTQKFTGIQVQPKQSYVEREHNTWTPSGRHSTNMASSRPQNPRHPLELQVQPDQPVTSKSQQNQVAAIPGHSTAKHLVEPDKLRRFSASFRASWLSALYDLLSKCANSAGCPFVAIQPALLHSISSCLQPS